ncbi:zeta toxin family protein [Ferruginibacter sp. SUN106]|uniref:zeta toxin family protein n=1 Tax=Ferruginibacter sp. SUN106 TaxID=2978348 RepID=UPI003D35B4AF
MPNLYIIAGCNGAGKTTASYTVLPEILDCKEFINADEIARGLSPFQPEKVAIHAGRIMLQRIDELIKLKIDFAIETTLTTKSYTKMIEVAKLNGYNVKLAYLWLNNIDLAIERVNARVKDGGHNIPEEVIRRRYKKGIFNLINIFIDLCDYWLVFDNSDESFTFVAEGDNINKTLIHNNKIWEVIKTKANE